MARILSTAVVVIAALWLIRDLYALESNQTSNNEDLYFDDSGKASPLLAQPNASSGPIPRRRTYPSAWSRSEKDDLKLKDSENDQEKSDGFLKVPEIIDSLNLKQLLKYVLSLITLEESYDNPSDELKDQPNSDIKDVANDQNKSVSSSAFNLRTNLSMISYTEYADTNEDYDDISEGDERDFENMENSSNGNESDDRGPDNGNNKNNQDPEKINVINQVIYTNTTVIPLSQNMSGFYNPIDSPVNKNHTGLLENNPVDDSKILKFDITSNNATVENNIPSFTLFEEEFIDEYINKQSDLPRYDKQKEIETTSNTTQPTIIDNGMNKNTENQVQDNKLEDRPLDISLIQFTNENINNPAKILDQNQNNRNNPVMEKQTIPQTSVYNVDTKEIPYSPSRNSFPRVEYPVISNKETEQNSELYRAPHRQNNIVQFPSQDTYVRSPFQNVPGSSNPYSDPGSFNPYNNVKPFNYQDNFNQGEPTYNFNPGTDSFTINWNPLSQPQQLPTNVLPKFNGYSYNQQYDRIPAVSEPRDQQNRFQQNFPSQNNPKSEHNLNQDPNVLQKSEVNKLPHFTYYKLKLPLHIKPIVRPPVSSSTFSDLPQDKFTNPPLGNRVPLYSPLSNKNPISLVNQEIAERTNNANLLKQPNILEPQNQIRTLPGNPNVDLENSMMQNQGDSLLAQNEYPQVTTAPPQTTTEVLIQNNDKPIEMQPTDINGSLPQNEYNNAKAQPSKDVFNDTGPIFQTQFNMEEPSQQEDGTPIPITNLENFTTTTGESITMLKNPPLIELPSSTFNNFSQDLQPKVNSDFFNNNSTSKSSVDSESEEESDNVERGNDEESDFVESGNEGESDLVESENEEESDLVESENEEESDLVESENEEESDLVESENEEEFDTDESESEEDYDNDESENKKESDDNENFEYEEEFNELLRILDYMEEIVNNTSTTESLGNSSTTDMDYFTKTPTNYTDFSTQIENEESTKPEETFNTILEYILKFSNSTFFKGMKEQQNVTMQ